MAKNVFAAYADIVHPYRYAGRLEIGQIMGGTPSDPKVAEGWLKSKMGIDKEDIIAQAVAEVMAARTDLTEADALKEVDKRRHLNGFKKDEDGLYIEGRHLKAALKEAASIARAVNGLDSRYGATNKGTLGFVAEHIIVVEDKLYLSQMDADGKLQAVRGPSGILQSFPRNPITRQTGIQYTEFVTDAFVDFTIQSDYEFKEKEWATIWLTGGQQGIGASRSQGYGRYKIVQWDVLSTPKKAKAAAAA